MLLEERKQIKQARRLIPPLRYGAFRFLYC